MMEVGVNSQTMRLFYERRIKRQGTQEQHNPTAEQYAARMRAGRTPWFRARTGRGQWGTGPERREAAIRSEERRRG